MDIPEISGEDLRSLLMAVQTAVVLIERDSRVIVFANSRAGEITGLSPGEMVGKVCHNFLCPSDSGDCSVCDRGLAIFDEPSYMLKGTGERYPVIKSVREIVLKDRPYLLETYIDSTNIEKSTEDRGSWLRMLTELQKVLLKPDSLSRKMDRICRFVLEIPGLETVQIWLNGDQVPLCDAPLSLLGAPFLLCSAFGTEQHLDGELLNRAFRQKDVIREVSSSASGSYVSSLLLTGPGGGLLGTVLLYSGKRLTGEKRSLLREIVETASLVILNSLAEYRLKEALELTEKANKLMEGREARIRDIKSEINDLTSKLGWGKVYREFEEEDFRWTMDHNDLVELRKNALSLAEDAEIERIKAVEAHKQLVLIKQALSSSGDAIAITLSNGDIYYTNQTFDELFGYSAAQIMMGRLNSLFGDRESFREIEEHILPGRSWSGSREVRKSDGSSVPVLLRVSSIRDEQGILLGNIWHFIDITRQIEDQRKIEQDLKEKKELLRKAMILQNSYIQRSIPLLEKFNMEALFYPCEDLGGDFFRILKGIREEKLIIILGDCTDHGIKASMDASLLSSLIDPLLYHLYENNRTDQFLHDISREFSLTADEDQFPTMFVMVIDWYESAVYYSSANSTNPLLLRNGAVSELPRAQGLHIGYEDEPVYERKHLVLQEGDCILFYSDALNESLSGGSLHFDAEHLATLFGVDSRNLKSRFSSLKTHLVGDTREFNTNDDMTLMLMEYRSPRFIEYNFSSMEEWKEQLDSVKNILEDFDYSEKELIPITISLDEMCINAFTHGNKGNKDLQVRLEGTISCKTARFTIMDEGDGFDFLSVADPRDQLEELLEGDNEEEYIHGRGIWICRSFMDRVEYTGDGNTVHMEISKRQKPVEVSLEK